MPPTRKLLATTSLLALSLAACGDASAGRQASSSAIEVQIEPAEALVAPLGHQAFAAAVTGTLATSVVWSVSEGGVGGSVSASGAYSAPAAQGTFHVVATSVADPSSSGSATVTVATAPPGTSITGNVSGRLALAASPYAVTGNLVVPKGSTLTIEPGVQLVFRGHYSLRVLGQIDARGTAAQPILFTAANATAGWYGLRLPIATTGTDTDQYLEHCILEYGRKDSNDTYLDGAYDTYRGAALWVYGGTKLHINDNVFRNNVVTNDKGGAVMLLSVGNGQTFRGNVFQNNRSRYQGAALQVTHMSGTVISGGAFDGNVATMMDPNVPGTGVGGAVYCVGGDVTVDGAELSGNAPDNWGNGAPADGCNMTLTNLTLR